MRGIYIRWIAGLFVGAFVLFVGLSACSHNNGRQELCEESGMTLAQDYWTRDFGCANVIPFEEFE